ncbi:hypothetical protein HK102_009756 [Quaeritorhiza haematococci]|nr:hypothetical protein HK102_009756 [Quaeritorhiza haematococci]
MEEQLLIQVDEDVIAKAELAQTLDDLHLPTQELDLAELFYIWSDYNDDVLALRDHSLRQGDTSGTSGSAFAIFAPILEQLEKPWNVSAEVEDLIECSVSIGQSERDDDLISFFMEDWVDQEETFRRHTVANVHELEEELLPARSTGTSRTQIVAVNDLSLQVFGSGEAVCPKLIEEPSIPIPELRVCDFICEKPRAIDNDAIRFLVDVLDPVSSHTEADGADDEGSDLLWIMRNATSGLAKPYCPELEEPLTSLRKTFVKPLPALSSLKRKLDPESQEPQDMPTTEDEGLSGLVKSMLRDHPHEADHLLEATEQVVPHFSLWDVMKKIDDPVLSQMPKCEMFEEMVEISQKAEDVWDADAVELSNPRECVREIEHSTTRTLGEESGALEADIGKLFVSLAPHGKRAINEITDAVTPDPWPTLDHLVRKILKITPYPDLCTMEIAQLLWNPLPAIKKIAQGMLRRAQSPNSLLMLADHADAPGPGEPLEPLVFADKAEKMINEDNAMQSVSFLLNPFREWCECKKEFDLWEEQPEVLQILPTAHESEKEYILTENDAGFSLRQLWMHQTNQRREYESSAFSRVPPPPEPQAQDSNGVIEAPTLQLPQNVIKPSVRDKFFDIDAASDPILGESSPALLSGYIKTNTVQAQQVTRSPSKASRLPLVAPLALVQKNKSSMKSVVFEALHEPPAVAEETPMELIPEPALPRQSTPPIQWPGNMEKTASPVFAPFSTRGSIDQFLMLRGRGVSVQVHRERLVQSKHSTRLTHPPESSMPFPPIPPQQSPASTKATVLPDTPIVLPTLDTSTRHTYIARSQLFTSSRAMVRALEEDCNVALIERDMEYLMSKTKHSSSASMCPRDADLIIDERTCIIFYPVEMLSQRASFSRKNVRQGFDIAPEVSQFMQNTELARLLLKLSCKYELVYIVLESARRQPSKTFQPYAFTPPTIRGLQLLHAFLAVLERSRWTNPQEPNPDGAAPPVQFQVFFSQAPEQSAHIARFA